ncbi:MAG TPA: hypothetical protein VGF14_07485, partial [Alphaproteobacteria bacterium]
IVNILYGSFMTKSKLQIFNQVKSDVALDLPLAGDENAYRAWLDKNSLHDIMSMLGNVPLDAQPGSAALADFLGKAYMTKFTETAKFQQQPTNMPRQPDDPFGMRNLHAKLSNVNESAEAMFKTLQVNNLVIGAVVSIQNGNESVGKSYFDKLQRFTDQFEHLPPPPKKSNGFWEKLNPFK